ncbi:MAG: hypothetical protein JWL63_1453 [Rhodocyclales bacterium]|nr:hypothetical protein [Rhodocyclales bacterium]
MSITRINNFEAKPGQADRLGEFLVSIVPLIEQSQGCESCQLLRSQENFNAFAIIEIWMSVAAHQASVKQIPPEKIAAVMPMLATPPTGTYYSIQA